VSKKTFLRPAITQIPHAYHGAIDFAELEAWGIAPDDILDFSVNSNPFGHDTAVREAIARAPLHRYPDKACLALRRALADHLGLADIDPILVGNGTAELLWLICFATLEQGDSALILEPTFGEYGRMVRLMGGRVISHRASETDVFTFDMPAIAAQLAHEQPTLCFLCNPNNPTGGVVAPQEIGRWADEHPQTLFVIDEAYLNFAENLTSVIQLQRPNILSLRSMTKDYALAGLRLGYLVGEQTLVEGIGAARVPWSVNELAQVAGAAVLRWHEQFVQDWQRLRQTAHHFKQELGRLGFPAQQSQTHFFLLPVGNGQAFRQHMLRHGVLVRLADSYDLPHMVRVATQTEEMNGRFMAAVKRYRP